MHGMKESKQSNLGNHLSLRGWYERKRKQRVDAEIRAIIGLRRAAKMVETPENRAMLPPLRTHKLEALTGDTVYLGHNDHIRSFILSALDRPEPGGGRVSVTSPIGRALLGRHQGDRVRLRMLDGDFDYTILKII
ncbi:MAG TPA: GreA/GreB family elongation factor [Candidatus Saccharimonadales bacterium]